MSAGSTQSPNTTHVEVATVALRNAYPVGLRQWGMRITVFDDPTPANNITYVLTKGLVDSDKANNNNFDQETPDEAQAQQQTLEVVSNKYSKEKFVFENATYVGGGSVTAILQGGDFINNQSFVVDFYMTGIQTNVPGNSGFGMKIRAMFRKDNAGTLTQIGASTQEWVYNDTGDSFSGTPSLAVNADTVSFYYNLTTAKTFSLSGWAKIRATI